MTAAAVEFQQVVKQFGSGPTAVTALAGVDLRVETASFVAVMGPSGCGKSTLLHLAAALDDPTAGSVRVGGRELAGLSMEGRAQVRRDTVGLVFQRLNLIASLTAKENVALPLELDGVRPKVARAAAADALARVGLRDSLDRYPDHFSGGQQQRIAVARALVGSRSVLLADEPTAALDTRSADDIVELLASLPASSGTTVVLVTHDPRLASWAQRTVFLRDGVVVDDTARLEATA